jgi:hypothetical protein
MRYTRLVLALLVTCSLAASLAACGGGSVGERLDRAVSKGCDKLKGK